MAFGGLALFVARIDATQVTELAKKVCPRLRDSASGRGGELTQPVGNSLF